MQFAVITGPTKEIALPRISLANTLTDGIELRLDLFKRVDLEEVAIMKGASKRKTIFTLRSTKAGGSYQGPENSRLDLIEKLLVYRPEYIDLESQTPKSFIEKVAQEFPDSKIILSYHNFEFTPQNLETLLEAMISPCAYAYKICTTANSLSDSYRMLRFIQKTTEKKKRIIGICMGEEGKITREEGIRSGNYLNYKILHNRDRCANGLQFV